MMNLVPMYECPYCYTPVEPGTPVCPKCGRELERWQTGFYTRQRPLATKSRTAVWAVAVAALLLVLAGLARACHWL
jgi:predicted nucleic acid-binding Zn ribbon protein